MAHDHLAELRQLLTDARTALSKADPGTASPLIKRIADLSREISEIEAARGIVPQRDGEPLDNVTPLDRFQRRLAQRRAVDGSV